MPPLEDEIRSEARRLNVVDDDQEWTIIWLLRQSTFSGAGRKMRWSERYEDLVVEEWRKRCSSVPTCLPQCRARKPAITPPEGRDEERGGFHSCESTS